MKILNVPTTKAECFSRVEPLEGQLVKAVVDVAKEIIAIDAGMHVDLEQYLLEQGSKQADLWGINFYPQLSGDNFIEFDSMINIRPGQGNRSLSVDDPAVRDKIKAIVEQLIL
jgi:hypothetical protein